MTITALAAVTALTLAACGGGSSSSHHDERGDVGCGGRRRVGKFRGRWWWRFG